MLSSNVDMKEISSYGETMDSKDGQGALLLDILTKYTEAFNSILDGKSEDMSKVVLAGGVRIHYIFQYFFVNFLEEVDPCDYITDEDIWKTIQNATGKKNALFVPEVPFEFLVQRKITRLLDPNLQCARFIFDELVKIVHQCETIELQGFSILRRHLEEVVGTFLCEGLALVETMIAHLISWRWTISILHIHDLLVEAKQWKLRYNNTYMSRFHSPPLN